uniref:DUF4283 domain-containing protein n=1 Tax=Manihot esculenta TaxID=3983 RepID=A0A2C9U4G5_MANES
MRNTLSSIWRPSCGIFMQELASKILLFQFFHSVDLRRVLDGGPWTFNNALLILHHLQVGDISIEVPLFHVQF